MKRISLIIILAVAITGIHSGCKNNKGNNADSTQVGTLTVDSFMLSPEKFAGKDVTIKGTVSHICKHSGKKLFIFGANPEKTVKVNAGGDFATFDIKYEGSEVEITGTVVEDEKIDANYLNEWEADIKKNLEDKDQKVCNEENKAISGQVNETAKKDSTPDPFADVKEFRKKLAESGKTYISIYAINVKTLKELKKSK